MNGYVLTARILKPGGKVKSNELACKLRIAAGYNSHPGWGIGIKDFGGGMA